MRLVNMTGRALEFRGYDGEPVAFLRAGYELVPSLLVEEGVALPHPPHRPGVVLHRCDVPLPPVLPGTAYVVEEAMALRIAVVAPKRADVLYPVPHATIPGACSVLARILIQEDPRQVFVEPDPPTR